MLLVEMCVMCLLIRRYKFEPNSWCQTLELLLELLLLQLISCSLLSIIQGRNRKQEKRKNCAPRPKESSSFRRSFLAFSLSAFRLVIKLPSSWRYLPVLHKIHHKIQYCQHMRIIAIIQRKMRVDTLALSLLFFPTK